MSDKINLNWFIIPTLLILAGFGFLYARYFLDKTVPEISFDKLEENGFYAKNFSYKIKVKDNYKIKDLSIWLDEKLILDHQKVSKKSFEYESFINTLALPNGKHKLKVQVEDASKNKNSIIKELNFIVDNTPLQVSLIKTGDYRVFQGHTLKIQFQSNKEVKNASISIFSKSYPFVPESENSLIYETFVPVKCEEMARENIFQINIEDNVGNKTTIENKFKVESYPFKKQNLTIAPEKIQESKDNGLPEKQLESKLQELSEKSSPKKLWEGIFYLPIENQEITTDFGVLRTTKERGKYYHAAIDLKAGAKDPVWAAQDGIVIVKNRYAHSGNTIVIDHGAGVFTLYFHLNDFAKIDVGDKIKKGQLVGSVGKTGYATGYHLHWEMRIKNVQVNPLQWIKSID